MEHLPHPADFSCADIACNLHELYRAMSADRHFRQADLEWVDAAPAPWPQFIFNTAVHADTVRRAQHLIESGKAPPYWIANETETRDAGSADLLRAAGFTPVLRWPGMAARPERIIRTETGTLTCSTDPPTPAWVQLLRRTHFPEAGKMPDFLFSVQKAGSALRFWHGTLAGELICGALTFQTGKVLGIYWMTTDPAFRQKGFGSQLLQNIAAWAVPNEIHWLCLQANRRSKDFYHRLGFETYCNFDIYRYVAGL